MTLFVVAAVVAAAFACSSAQVRGHRCGRGCVVGRTQLDGTVVTVGAWCCVLPLLSL